MFSPSLEVVLTVAYREASARRHTYLTLEHLLYALAHDPDGERILAACGADLPQLRRELDEYLDDLDRAVPRGQQKEPEQTAAFRRVLQTAVLHVQSAQAPGGAGRRHPRGDPAAAEVARGAAAGGAGHHAARHPRIHLARHQQGAAVERRRGDPDAASGRRRSRRRRARRGDVARPAGGLRDESDRARARGVLDPLIGRAAELQRTIEILCRRRKNNPVFVGDAGVGKTAMAEGLATRLLAGRRARRS